MITWDKKTFDELYVRPLPSGEVLRYEDPQRIFSSQLQAQRMLNRGAFLNERVMIIGGGYGWSAMPLYYAGKTVHNWETSQYILDNAPKWAIRDCGYPSPQPMKQPEDILFEDSLAEYDDAEVLARINEAWGFGAKSVTVLTSVNIKDERFVNRSKLYWEELLRTNYPSVQLFIAGEV